MAVERIAQIGEPTGWVIATSDAVRAGELWHEGLGFAQSREHQGELPSRQHPDSGQRVTVAQFDEPDPPIALGVRCADLDASFEAAEAAGLTEYWRATSAEGTAFVMCLAEPGVFILLYQLRSTSG